MNYRHLPVSEARYDAHPMWRRDPRSAWLIVNRLVSANRAKTARKLRHRRPGVRRGAA